jgi:hypothetical protein
MATQIQFRRGTGAQHSSFTGAVGEVTVNTTEFSLHVHDGSTAGGQELAKADLSNLSGTPNLNVGIVTATSFVGDGSGLTGAGSTVSDDTTTNETFYPLFTQTTSGTVTASKVSTSKLTFNPSTGTLTVVDINSSSDEKLKENIRVVENPLEKIVQLNGVQFNWKETKETSIGVIAQDVEKVFPELVKTAENKSVNYNGLIGVLIEAIKEQQNQINSLQSQLNNIMNNQEQ